MDIKEDMYAMWELTYVCVSDVSGDIFNIMLTT